MPRPPVGLDCFEGAATESFFATLECELLDRRSWPTRRALATAVCDYAEAFHHRRRRHSTLGYLSPADDELPPLRAAPAAQPTRPPDRVDSRGGSAFSCLDPQERGSVRRSRGDPAIVRCSHAPINTTNAGPSSVGEHLGALETVAGGLHLT